MELQVAFKFSLKVLPWKKLSNVRNEVGLVYAYEKFQGWVSYSQRGSERNNGVYDDVFSIPSKTR